MKKRLIIICSALSALALGCWFTADYARAASQTSPNYWREFSHREYTFNIPAAWKTKVNQDADGRETVIFTNKNNAYVGQLICPMGDDGGAEMPYTTKSRTIYMSDASYDIRLRTFYPSLKLNRSHAMLTLVMRNNKIKPSLTNLNPNQGCELEVQNADNLVPLFRQIYESVKIYSPLDKWQTFTNKEQKWSINLPPGFTLIGNRVDDVSDPENPAPVINIDYYAESDHSLSLEGYELLDADPFSIKDFSGVKLEVKCRPEGSDKIYLLKHNKTRWKISSWECYDIVELEQIVRSLKQIK